MLFKLKPKTGNHSQKDAQGNLVVYNYRDGHVFESDIDLEAQFPEKFERVKVPAAEPEPKNPPNIIKAAQEGTAEIKKCPECEAVLLAGAKFCSECGSAAEEKSEEVQETEVEDNDLEPLGKDVTEKFPRAEEEDLLVFYKKGKGYFVTEVEDPYTRLNKKKIGKKTSVTPFIEKYLKG